MFCRNCGSQLADDAAFCMSCGTPTATGPLPPLNQQPFPPPQMPPNPGAAPGGAPPPYYVPQTGQAKSPSSTAISIIGIVVMIPVALAVIGIIAAIAIPNFLRARSRSQYTACYEQLQHVKTGVESYISESGSAQNLNDGADEACDHILPGYKSPQECAGMVRTRVATSCSMDFSVKAVSPTQYEISGHARDRTTCGIMITESAALPKSYNDCTAEIPGPVHDDAGAAAE